MVKVVLAPLLLISWVYGAVVWMRKKLYESGVLKTGKLPCQVVSVGNLTLGGTGKTPMVIYLATELQKMGVRVGILTRGYQGSRERTGGVVSDGERIHMTPAESGDEPFMLATLLKGIPLLVGKNRYEMGLLAHTRFGVDVMILDDGFQHVALARDLDIVLIDTRKGFGNGYLFPRGPLREPLIGLQRATCLVFTKSQASQDMAEIEEIVRNVVPTVPAYHSTYRPAYLVEGSSGKMSPPGVLRDKKVLAFAGIADPEYFAQLLDELGADLVDFICFPDHHAYALKDVSMMHRYVDKVDVFVTTHKDFVKLGPIVPHDFPLFVLGVTQEILEAETFARGVLCKIARQCS